MIGSKGELLERLILHLLFYCLPIFLGNLYLFFSVSLCLSLSLSLSLSDHLFMSLSFSLTLSLSLSVSVCVSLSLSLSRSFLFYLFLLHLTQPSPFTYPFISLFSIAAAGLILRTYVQYRMRKVRDFKKAVMDCDRGKCFIKLVSVTCALSSLSYEVSLDLIIFLPSSYSHLIFPPTHYHPPFASY